MTESEEAELIDKYMKTACSEAFKQDSSYVEATSQSSDIHHVIHHLRSILVKVLNSAWNEDIPLDSSFTRNEFRALSSGRSSRKITSGVASLKWHLRSDPAKLELSRATILSSRFGMKLHERGLMGKVTAVLGILTMAIIFTMPYTEVRQGNAVWIKYEPFGWVLLYGSGFILIVALQHRMSRALWVLTYSCFETWVLTIAMVVKCGSRVYQALQVFPFSDVGVDAMLGDVLLYPIFYLHVNCIDCWRFPRKAKVCLVFLVLVLMVWEYFTMRCERTYWELSTDCSLNFDWRTVDGIRLREIYLGLLVSCFLFFAKALHRHLIGQVFAVWHPQYCLRDAKSTTSDSIRSPDDILKSLGKDDSDDVLEKVEHPSIRIFEEGGNAIIGQQQDSSCASLNSEQAHVAHILPAKFSL